MSALLRLAGLSLGATALACALGGCVAVPVHDGGPGYSGYGYQYDGYRGPPPVVGYVWIDGFWDWRLGRRVWIGGHWGPPHGHRGHRGRW